MKKSASQIADQVLEKVALNLAQARRATQALMRKGFTRGIIGLNSATGKPFFARKLKGLRGHLPIGWGAVTPRPTTERGLGRVLDPRGVPVAPEIKQLTQEVLPRLPGNKARIFATGKLTEAPKQLLRDRAAASPEQMKALSPKLAPKQQEMFNRIGLLHEGVERQFAAQPHGKINRGRWKAMQPGHLAPEVLLQESGMLATLPKEYTPVRQAYQKIRGELEPPTLAAIQEVYPGYEHGVTRMSRHARRHVGDILRAPIQE